MVLGMTQQKHNRFYKLYFRLTSAIFIAALLFFITSSQEEEKNCDIIADEALQYYQDNVESREWQPPEVRMYHLNQYLNLSREFYTCMKKK